MMCYMTPMAVGAKRWGTPENDFWCCYGTGIENHARYGEGIYFHRGGEELWVNLFIASEVYWREAGMWVTQQTEYPDDGSTRLVVKCRRAAEGQVRQLNIRRPWWAVSGFKIGVNGEMQAIESQPGGFATVKRKWHSGDAVEVVMPMSLRLEGFKDNPKVAAVMYGPLVMCAESEASPEWPWPALVADEGRRFAKFEPVEGQTGAFAVPAETLRVDEKPRGERVRPAPLMSMGGGKKYVVYWNVFSKAAWQAEMERVKVARAELEARTVDRVIPGDQKSEGAHHVQGEKTGSGMAGYRHALEGGWFSWEMKVLPAGAGTAGEVLG